MQGAPKAGPSQHVEIRRRSLRWTDTAHSSSEGSAAHRPVLRSGAARESLTGTACVQATLRVIAATIKTALANPRKGIEVRARFTSRRRRARRLVSTSAKRWLGLLSQRFRPCVPQVCISAESRLQATGQARLASAAPRTVMFRSVGSADVQCGPRRPVASGPLRMCGGIQSPGAPRSPTACIETLRGIAERSCAIQLAGSSGRLSFAAQRRSPHGEQGPCGQRRPAHRPAHRPARPVQRPPLPARRVR